MTHSRRLTSKKPPRGIAVSIIVFAIAVVTALGAGIWYRLAAAPEQVSMDDVMLHRVSRGDFSQIVTERGEISSSTNVDIRCQVKSRNTTGTTILSIVPEGTFVNEGDLLCRLDASSLELELTQQQIVENTSKSVLIQSKNVYDLAVIAKESYLDGEFRELEQTIQSEIFVAEESERRAEQVLEFSERMARKGYNSAIQLEADKYALDKAKNDLELANTKLYVLRNHTKEKMLTQLDADIKTAEAKWMADESSYKLDVAKLKEIQGQIDACEIHAPAAGQVVYANQQGRRGGDDIIIEAGAVLREQQIICRLPDPNKMQVDTRVNESRISLVKVGMPAVVLVDAFPDMQLRGRVTKVNDYPEPSGWSSSTKEYLAVVEILDTSEEIRPGLTAQAQILVDEIPNALQIPVQAVMQHAEEYFTLVKRGGDFIAQSVDIGANNDSFVVVRSGLEESDEVAMNIRKYWDHFKPESASDEAESIETPEETTPETVAQTEAETNSPASRTSAGTDT